MDCYACSNISGEKPLSPDGIIYHGNFWIIDHAYPTTLPGWIVIVLKRHATALHELTKEEFLELAELQEKVLRLLHQELHCEKEYIAAFGEANHFNHIHFHIIPKTEIITKELRGPRSFALLKVEDIKLIPRDKIIKISRTLKKYF